MNLNVTQGNIAATVADVIVVNLFEGVTAPGGATGAVDVALGGQISQLIAAGDIRGKSGEITLLHTFGKLPAARVVVAGLGKQGEFDIDAVRNLAANLARALRKPGIKTVATICHGAGIGGLSPADCAQAIAEGALLGEYRFLKHKSSTEDRDEITSLTIVENDAAKIAELTTAADRGRILAEATNRTRDMANEPSNHMYPADLAAVAVSLAAALGIARLGRAQVEGPVRDHAHGVQQFAAQKLHPHDAALGVHGKVFLQQEQVVGQPERGLIA